MRRVIIAAVLASLATLLWPQTDNTKVWIQPEGCVTQDGEAKACFWFVEDKETHTRCYAFRSEYHEGAAISCVAVK